MQACPEHDSDRDAQSEDDTQDGGVGEKAREALLELRVGLESTVTVEISIARSRIPLLVSLSPRDALYSGQESSASWAPIGAHASLTIIAELCSRRDKISLSKRRTANAESAR